MKRYVGYPNRILPRVHAGVFCGPTVARYSVCMLNNSRMVFGVALLVVLGVIIWAYVTGVKPSAPAPRATTTPPAHVDKKPPKVEDTVPAPLSARVTIETPTKNATVGKSFAVQGKAPGNWYFEASFPIQVRSAEGNVIGRGIAQAQSDWMTTELVAFKTTVTIEGGYTGPARLILLRDNPSGLPENDDAVEIDIVVQ